jgi:CheY-like chemotaxis protein
VKSRPSRNPTRSLRGEIPTAPHAILLHVDDDANDSELLRAAIAKANLPIELRTASNGEQAIAYLAVACKACEPARHPIPTLVLLDLKMPRASGFDVLKAVRQRPELIHLPVVVLSGSELTDDMRAAYESGANSYLVKPLSFDSLVMLVRGVYGLWLKPQGPAA